MSANICPFLIGIFGKQWPIYLLALNSSIFYLICPRAKSQCSLKLHWVRKLSQLSSKNICLDSQSEWYAFCTTIDNKVDMNVWLSSFILLILSRLIEPFERFLCEIKDFNCHAIAMMLKFYWFELNLVKELYVRPDNNFKNFVLWTF